MHNLIVAGLYAVSIACVIGCIILGTYVSPRPPEGIDAEASVLRGRGLRAAIVFTELGYWQALTALSVVAALAAWFARLRLDFVVAIIVSQIVSQLLVMWLKRTFRRQRPNAWLVRQETDLSYPSGHSATAMTFYLPLTFMLATSALPLALRVALAAVSAVCVFGVPWSRLALGAHYSSDVFGGLLFGLAWTMAIAAIFAREFIA